jgi:hypothetical protein
MQPIGHLGYDPREWDVQKDLDGASDKILTNYGEAELLQEEWPRSQLQGSNADEDMTPSWVEHPSPAWEYNVSRSGSKYKKKYSGITYDQNGDVLPGCTVALYQTSDKLFIAWCYSDTLGYYELYTPYNEAHFLVAGKSGPSAVAGATVDTILGT